MKSTHASPRRVRSSVIGSRAYTSRAFTIMELLVSIAVIGMLIALVVFGVRGTRKAVKGVTYKLAVENAYAGMTKFKEQFAFVPALVKQRDLGPGVTNPAVPGGQSLTRVAGGRNVVSLFDRTIAADVLFLNTQPTSINSATNPFLDDHRYSTVELAYYLAGGLEKAYSPTVPAIPMDGVKGPGMFKPLRDGTFEVPKEVRDTGGVKKVGTSFESFVNLSASMKMDLNPAIDPANENRGIELLDAGGKALRFYRWINGVETPAGSGNYVVNGLADLRLPAMVGRISREATVIPNDTTFLTPAERDARTNIELRGATWAIVGAGPNGVFGDEPLSEIALKVGKSNDAADEAKLRAEAENDNIVKVGNDDK